MEPGKVFLDIVDRCPLAILVVDNNLRRILYANQAALTIFRVSGSTLIGEALNEQLEGSDSLFNEQKVDVSLQLKLVSNPSSKLLVRAYRENLENQEYLIMHLYESDEELQYAQLLRDKEILSAIIQDQSEYIVRWKGDGIRTFVNDAYCKAFKITREEALGTSFYSNINENYLKETIARLDALSPRNPVSSKAHKVKLQNGKDGWQHWTDRAFFDKDGNVVEYQSVGRDVTELLDIKMHLSQR
jgi:PAS domain S-box-containing protein